MSHLAWPHICITASALRVTIPVSCAVLDALLAEISHKEDSSVPYASTHLNRTTRILLEGEAPFGTEECIRQRYWAGSFTVAVVSCDRFLFWIRVWCGFFSHERRFRVLFSWSNAPYSEHVKRHANMSQKVRKFC